VRAAALTALTELKKERATELMRPYLDDPEPRLAAAAAVALGKSDREEDIDAAEATLQRLATDGRDSAAAGRRESAHAIGQLRSARYRNLLLPLMYDTNLSVANEAIAAARSLGTADFIFVPTLISLLRNRRLKKKSREVIVSYGEGVLETLAYFLRDPNEEPWVRRHLPNTIARIPCQKSIDILLETLNDEDGYVRHKTLSALEKLRRENPELHFDPTLAEKMAERESRRYFRYLGLHYNLFEKGGLDKENLLSRAFEEKLQRIRDRLFRSAGIVFSWKDTAAARWAIERGDARARSSALEYMDNMLTGTFRKHLMPILEEMPIEDKVRRGNVLLKTRVRDVEETLTRLIYDDDPVIAALAIDLVRELKMWSLAEDLEQALAFGEVRDFAVFTAASHALAEHRLGKEVKHAI
jgi:HEAT repeat protein